MANDFEPELAYLQQQRRERTLDCRLNPKSPRMKRKFQLRLELKRRRPQSFAR